MNKPEVTMNITKLIYNFSSYRPIGLSLSLMETSSSSGSDYQILMEIVYYNPVEDHPVLHPVSHLVACILYRTVVEHP